MLDVLADPLTEGVQDDLADDEEEDPKRNIAQRPPILQRVHHQNNLHHNIDQQLNPINQIQHDEQPGRVHRPQPCPPLEREQTDRKRNHKHPQTRQPQQPHRKRRTVLVELKSHKPINKQTRTQRTRQPILNRRKIRVYARATRRDHARIEDQTKHREEHVDVEEGGDFLPADGGEFAADVQDHDDGHGQGEDVHRVGGALEDDGVGEFEGAGVAGSHYAGGGGGGDVGAWADEGAEGDGGLGAYCGEVAEGHGGQSELIDGGGEVEERLEEPRGATVVVPNTLVVCCVDSGLSGRGSEDAGNEIEMKRMSARNE